jgi:Na+/H+-translocating membrane pyrophosphatase
MVAVWLPILGVGVAATVAWQLGTMTQLTGGGTIGLSTGLAAALGVAVYAVALGALRPVSQASLGLRAVKRRAQGNDERREIDQLQGLVLEVGTVARTYFATLGPAAALFAILALPTSAESATSGLSPAILCAGFLGAATVLVFAGHTLTVAARAARSSAAEVERQLKGFPKGTSGIAIPDEFTPTYRILVDQASKAGLSRLLPPIALAIGAPLALGIALRLLYSSGRPAIQGLMAFIVIAAVTGLATALTVDATRAVLGAAHRSNLPRGTHPGFQISAEGEALADLVGTTAGPASLLLTKTLATAVLIIAPLLS